MIMIIDYKNVIINADLSRRICHNTINEKQLNNVKLFCKIKKICNHIIKNAIMGLREYRIKINNEKEILILRESFLDLGYIVDIKEIDFGDHDIFKLNGSWLIIQW